MTARTLAPVRPNVASHPSEPSVMQAQLQNFDDYKRRHSKQNRDIIRENANRLILNRNLQEEVARLHVKLLEEKAEKSVLAEELRRTKEELERVRSESSKEALDAILATVPALKQLRHKLGPRRISHTQASSSSSQTNSARRIASDPSSKGYPEVVTWEGRPNVVDQGKPGLDDLVEATEKGSECDWTYGGPGGGNILVAGPTRPESDESSHFSPTPQVVLSSTASPSPQRIIVRPRGRRESAMFARNAKSPSPEPLTQGLRLVSTPVADEVAASSSASPPPPATQSPACDPPSPLRRSPRKAATRNYARGVTVASPPPSVVDTGTDDSANKQITRKSLAVKRRSIGIPVSYTEDDAGDQVEDQQLEMDTKIAKAGEKRRRGAGKADVPEPVVEEEERISGASSSGRSIALVKSDVCPNQPDTGLQSTGMRGQYSIKSGRTVLSTSTATPVSVALPDPEPIEPNPPIGPEEDSGAGRGTRRARTSVSYKEPSLNTKMRKPDGTMTDLGLAAARRVTGGTAAGPILNVQNDRSRSTTPVNATPARGQSHLGYADTPSALPSDNWDEEIVEALTGNNPGHTLTLDARSSNTRRKSVLPRSKREESENTFTTIRPSSSGSGSSLTGIGALKALAKDIAVTSSRPSDIARTLDLPSSLSDTGSPANEKGAAEVLGSRDVEALGQRARRPLTGITQDGMGVTRDWHSTIHRSPVKARSMPVKSDAMGGMGATPSEHVQAAQAKAQARRQSGIMRR